MLGGLSTHPDLEAARRGDLAFLEAAHEAGRLAVEVRDELGAGLLHYAARSGCADCLAFLVRKAGLLPRARSSLGATAAHDAAAAGHLSALSWLLKHSDCEVSDQDAEVSKRKLVC